MYSNIEVAETVEYIDSRSKEKLASTRTKNTV